MSNEFPAKADSSSHARIDLVSHDVAGDRTVTPIQERAESGDELDLTGIGAALSRRKGLIGGVTAACFLGALAFVIVIKPTYTGDARVIIENQESYFTQPDRASGGNAAPAPDSEAIASQVELIKSRDIARAAIRKLGLKGNPEFDPLASGQSLVSRVLMLVGLKSSLRQLSPEDRILKYYSKKLTVFESPKSRVVNIQFSAKDSKLAARGANTIAGLYISQQQKAKRERARVAAVSLAGLITELRSKLAVAEGKVESFRASSGLMVGANNALLPSQQLSEIIGQLAAARTSMADTQAKAQLIRQAIRNGQLDEISEIARDNGVRRLFTQRSSVRSQLALESRTLGPAHPRIKELRAQLSSINNDLRIAARKSARGYENDAKIAKVRVTNLQAAVSNQQKKVGDTSFDQVKLREFELESKLIRTQLENNLTKYREAVARQNALSTPGDARIISKAFEPIEPSFPKKLPVLIFATIAGFVLSLGFVISSELLSGRAFVPGVRFPAGGQSFSPRDLRDRSPQLVAANDEINPAQTGASAHTGLGTGEKRLLAKISRLDPTGYGRRIMVCAESAHVDHAAAIEPLARVLSARNKVVMVDLSGRMLVGHSGISELLEGTSSFGQVIERDLGSRLHVIARGLGPVEIGRDLDAVLEALSQTYQYIFLVMADDDENGDALLLAPAADLALVACSEPDASDVAQKLSSELLGEGAGEVAFWDASGKSKKKSAEAEQDAAA